MSICSVPRRRQHSGWRRQETEEASSQQNHLHDGPTDRPGEGVREDALPGRIREGGAGETREPQ